MPRLTAAAKTEVRERLLAAAAEEFAAAGFDAARIDTIAARAGVAKGSVYNYFSTKEDLFAAVIAEGARAAAENFHRLPTGGTTRETLEALAAADVEVVRAQEAFQKVVVREAMSFRPTTYPLVVEHLAPYISAVTGVIESGVASGEVRSDQPSAQLALAFVGILGLLYVQHWGSGGTWPTLDEIPRLAVTLFYDGAGPRDGSSS